MAKNDDQKNIKDLSSRSNILIYGTDNALNDEDTKTSNIITQTILSTKERFGIKTSGRPINYFNELNIGDAFEEMRMQASGDKKKSDEKAGTDFKEYMTDNPNIDATSLLVGDQGRLINFANYRTIYEHIPECAQALDVYKDNIMSPDDFTKMIFDVNYDSNIDPKSKSYIEDQLKDLIEEYEIEQKADEILETSLKLGEAYAAVLSIDKELSWLMNKRNGISSGRSIGEILNEENTAILLDRDASSTKILSESIDLSEMEMSTLKEIFRNPESDKEVIDSDIQKFVANIINENVEIGSSSEILTERVLANRDFGSDRGYSKTDIPGIGFDVVTGKPYSDKEEKKNRKKKEKDAETPLYINGSVIRLLDPDRVIELKVDNVCYGYYYVEDTTRNMAATAGSSYLGTSSGREVRMGTGVNMGLNRTSPGATTYTPSTSAASMLGVGEEKLKVITNVFVNQIATKIDKSFIRKNKKFKEFIYELIKQDYIINKGIRMTYFGPDEVVKFEVPPIYRKIVFAAKMYLSTMTNDILIKLGRAHDKRAFYINVGLDAAYEQAVNKVIDDIKRREYRMDNLNDFNSILNLNPGRFDDYFIPTVNGDRPIEIDTLAGMDSDLNSEFLQFLKNTMLAGIGVPTNLIDNMNDISFARTLSAQNSNFVRTVIRYQKLLTNPFSRLISMLYRNEYRYVNDAESNIGTKIDFSKIRVRFPSPASLNMTNISEQTQSADMNADFIANQLLPATSDGSNEDARVHLKAEIVKDLVPGIDWAKYEKLYEDMKLNNVKDDLEKSLTQSQDPNMMDPYGGGQQY